MDNLKKLVEDSINLAWDRFPGALMGYEQLRRFGKKQQALAAHFQLPRERLCELRIAQQEAGGVDLNNVVYCIKQFFSEQVVVLEEGNYERAHYTDAPAEYPLSRELEVEPGIFIGVWAEVTVFFKWHEETYCFTVSPGEVPEISDCQIMAKTPEALKAFTDAFREYQNKNHYLKGKKFMGLAGTLMPLSSYGWSDIVLPNGLSERIRLEVDGVLRCAGTLSRYGLNSKKGFILAGEPGNGKTLLLKILANTTNVTCILVPFNRKNEEKAMSGIFKLARKLAPTMLILEDVDLYGEEREDTRDSEYLGELMNELDGMIDNKEIIVFATTNHLARVEKALQNRPGRFDRVYKIMNPDFAGRCSIIKHFINRVPHQITEQQIEALAESFSGYSGAYLKELVNSGFAQAILRNETDPVLLFGDLNGNLEVLKNNPKRPPIGFESANHARSFEGVKAVRKENV